MKLRQIIPIFLILFPIIEIVLFVEIGSIIGSFHTILIIIISAFFGFYLIKHHAISYIAEVQNKLLQGIKPENEIFSGILLFFSGILLIVPGFFTDFIALLLLFRPTRVLIISKYASSNTGWKKTRSKGSIIDVDHKEDK